MNRTLRNILTEAGLWALAIIIAVTSMIYQRRTGPTYPITGTIQVGEYDVTYDLKTSHYSHEDAVSFIVTQHPDIRGIMAWKRYKSYDTLMTAPLTRYEDTLKAIIPKQPPAGKIEYSIKFYDAAEKEYPLTDEPVIIRFKGYVPSGVLIPHVLAMILAMILAARAGLDGLFKGKGRYIYTILATSVVFVGGLILGPIVQKYAFGAFWTGWPFGQDLTDNKTLVAFIFWLLALWRGRKNRWWIVAAAAVTLVIYLIPHSMLGSEIDYTQAE